MSKKMAHGTEIMTASAPWSAPVDMKHDKVSSAFTDAVLPWEDREVYHALLRELTEAHRPKGITERFLVEELASLMWRKRRLQLAEAASFRDGLQHVTTRSYKSVAKAALVGRVRHVKGSDEAVKDALLLSDQEAEHELADVQSTEKKARRALRLLRDGKPDAYERALKVLPADTREWWNETLEGEAEAEWDDPLWDDEDAEDCWQASPESLAEFLHSQVLPWVEQRITELTHRADIRLQAVGEALTVHELVNLARYEAHLTSQFRQTLAMLLELQRQRQDAPV
jgi:hypothetical protein